MTEPTAEKPKKRRHGPMPKPEAQQRKHRVSIFLTDAEFAQLKEKAGDNDLPVFVRTRAINGKLAPQAPKMPKLNIEIWKKLSRVSNNLNQIAKLLHGGVDVEVERVLKNLAAFRYALLVGGLKPEAQSDEESV
ncbi:Bacterial mobilization protein (MobC) [compost metagenome]